jgi:hypothetical protein
MESEMNTHTIESAIKSASEWSPGRNRDSRIAMSSGLNPGLNLRGALCLATRALVALGSTLAIFVGSAWLVDLPGAAVYLQAILGAGGFVFLALAVDSARMQTALLQLATGIALPVLAWLSSREAVEIALVAAALVAVWVTAAVWQSTAPR